MCVGLARRVLLPPHTRAHAHAPSPTAGSEVATAAPGVTGTEMLLPEGAAPDAVDASAPSHEPAAGAAAGAAIAGPLAWLPATPAAIALRLYTLDASVAYREGHKPARERMEAYKYIQRPAVPAAAGAAGAARVSGEPIAPGGRVLSTLLPPVPQRLLYGPRSDFTFQVGQFQADVAVGSDALVVAAPKRGLVGRGKGRGKRPRTTGEGSARGGGGVARSRRNTKSTLAKEMAAEKSGACVACGRWLASVIR
jgi:hypothetical protein